MAADQALPNMAATQAESQQNEVNRDRDQVQPEQASDLANPILQNGTEKNNGGRGPLGGPEALVASKSKSPGQSNLALEMSQYRENSGLNNSSGNGDPGPEAKLGADGRGDVQGFGLGLAARGFHEQQSEALHHQFNQFGQNLRHSFSPAPMMAPRPPGFAPHGQHGQRFVSGQTISQPTGPTPTLNLLLKSSNPSRYGEFAMQKPPEQPSYGQSWPPPRPHAAYSPQQVAANYRNQPPVSLLTILQLLLSVKHVSSAEEQPTRHVPPT